MMSGSILDNLPPGVISTPEMVQAIQDMEAGATIIDVWNCRAAIARFRRAGSGWTVERAHNWEDLEIEAAHEVDLHGGYINLSGQYPCSDKLASMALWEGGSNDDC